MLTTLKRSLLTAAALLPLTGTARAGSGDLEPWQKVLVEAWTEFSEALPDHRDDEIQEAACNLIQRVNRLQARGLAQKAKDVVSAPYIAKTAKNIGRKTYQHAAKFSAALAALSAAALAAATTASTHRRPDSDISLTESEDLERYFELCSAFTPQEQSIWDLRLAGHSERQIAAQLGTSRYTVSSTLEKVTDKLSAAFGDDVINSLRALLDLGAIGK